MKNLYLFQILKSRYCQAVFVVFFIGSYFLVPRHVFYSQYIILALTFMVVFSLSSACLVRNIKDKILTATHLGRSAFHIIIAALGFSALQVCGLGATMCSATIGVSIASVLFPGIFFNYLTNYSIAIISASIILQIAGLYSMKCLRSEL